MCWRAKGDRVRDGHMKSVIIFMILMLMGCSTTTIKKPEAGSDENRMQKVGDASVKEGESLSSANQQWIDQSCSRSLGPSLWSKCVQRETTALKSGVPDLSSLSTEDQEWIKSSCSRSLGPSLTIRCMQREKAAIEAGMPDISILSRKNQNWLAEACSKSLGPSLYGSCMNRESAALAGVDFSRSEKAPRTKKSERTNSYEKQWNCKAVFGDEVVLKLAFNDEVGFVTMLDQEYEGNYDVDGITRIWSFGDSKNPEYFRYRIELKARGIAYLFVFEKDGSVRSQETLRCER